VFVEGRFKTRQFEGRDGQTRTSLEITADSIVNLERRPRDDEGSFNAAPAGASPVAAGGGGNGGGAAAVRPQRAPADDTDYDDLPF
jgi:single-stranded DNA-binding protein